MPATKRHSLGDDLGRLRRDTDARGRCVHAPDVASGFSRTEGGRRRISHPVLGLDFGSGVDIRRKISGVSSSRAVHRRELLILSLTAADGGC